MSQDVPLGNGARPAETRAAGELHLAARASILLILASIPLLLALF